MGCHSPLRVWLACYVTQASGRFQFLALPLKCASLLKSQQALKLLVPFNIKEVKRGLIFLSPLHCIKKNTHPCKTLSLRVQKTGNAPRVLRHRGCNLSASQPLVAPPFVPLADGSRSPCLALS